MKSIHAVSVGIAVVAGMCAGIMYGVRTGSAVVSVTAFIFGSFLLILVKRSVNTVIEDEWTRLVEQKASSLTLNITVVVFAIIGLFLISVTGPEQNYDQAVFAIAAFLVSLAVIYVIVTVWYSRALRGKDP